LNGQTGSTLLTIDRNSLLAFCRIAAASCHYFSRLRQGRSTGPAVVAVALIVGIAWLAVAVPVLIATAAGYGFLSLRRRAWRGKTHGNRTPQEF